MLIVQKYGGTSVANPKRIKDLARRIGRVVDAGDKVVVVVSAMAGETDRLIDLARQITENPDERELDMLVSTGERVTIALMAMALQDIGYPAQSFTGRQVGIITDSVHTKARIERVDAERVKNALDEGKIPVVAGFQGIDEKSDVTTLGRGGSDLTAVALADALKADICEIYTDVDGVYTSDPDIVPQARRLEKISYEEMLEMASLGTKVLQTRSVEYAMKYNVPLVVRSSFNENPGTLVTREDSDMEKVVVSGVTYSEDDAKITIVGVPDRPGVAARLFGSIADSNIVVDMIIQNISSDGKSADISFTVPKGDLKNAIEITKDVARGLGARDVLSNEDIAKVSIVGVGMRTHSGVAARMFSTLAEKGINIMMISTSEIKISCVIESRYTGLAVKALHDAFDLSRI